MLYFTTLCAAATAAQMLAKTNTTLLMNLSACQTTLFPTPHCHRDTVSPHKHAFEQQAHKYTSTDHTRVLIRILTHTLIKAAYRLAVVRIVKELQSTLLLSSLQFNRLI